MLLQAWILPVPHARMQSEHNSLIPPHVPIKVNISSADVQHVHQKHITDLEFYSDGGN